MNRKDAIFIESYDPNWPHLAKQEIEKLQAILSHDNLVAIEHIGSTSIPHATAKPIIDLYVAVNSIEQARQEYVEPIVSLGYVYWAENPNLDKLFFVKGMPPYGEKRTHHIHVVRHKSDYWRDRLVFRDYLRAHPEAVERYNELKKSLGLKHQNDREAYTDAKNAFVVEILKKAGIQKGGRR